MSEFTSEELKNEVHAILVDADLTVVTAKSVREKIEKKFNCHLLSRKKECDKYVMDFITARNEEEGSDNEDELSSADEDDSIEKIPVKGKKASPKKRVQPRTESDFTPEQLKKEIHAILADADLSGVTTKAVREQIENKFDCSLLSRKQECDKIIMDFINARKEEEGSDIEEEQNSAAEDNSSDSSPVKPRKAAAKKRPQPTQRKAATKKRKTLNADDSGTESDNGADSDYEVPKKPKAAKKKAANGGTPRKANSFTRALTLSPELSELMQTDALPRHEVVRKVWAIIKERNLYDPKNKQYAICDEDLLKVMKVKRFRTFGMLKHLKPHFIG